MIKNFELNFNNHIKKIYCYSCNSPEYIIYAFDGQNIFNNYDNYHCHAKDSLELEKLLSDLGVPALIVGIDNSEGEYIRDSELTLSKNFGEPVMKTGGFLDGKLELTGEFIVNELMPFIEKTFNVTHNQNNTVIMGASSGGLGSFYVGLNYDIFGKIISLSPATGLFTKQAWQNYFDSKKSAYKPEIYIYCGYDSSDDLENYLYSGDNGYLSSSQIKDFLIKQGYDKNLINTCFLKGGIHNEFYWHNYLKQIFPTVFKSKTN